MKVCVLAAGKGSRLAELNNNKPKILVELDDGSTILDHHLSYLAESSVLTGMLIVTGYKAKVIDEKLKQLSTADKQVCTAYNPFYELAGPLASLWVVRKDLGEEDFVIVNGDTIYDHRMIADVLDRCSEGISLTVSHFSEYEEDTVKVQLKSDGTLHETSKDMAEGETYLKSAGMLVVRGVSSRKRIVEEIERIGREQPVIQRGMWHELVNRLAGSGERIAIEEVPAGLWGEIDDRNDLLAFNQRVRLNNACRWL